MGSKNLKGTECIFALMENTKEEKKDMMITKRWKKAAALLLAGAMFFTMAGCGGERGTDANTGSGDAGGTEADTGNAKEEQDGNAGKGDATAMGRYVEEQIDLSDRIMSPYMDLCKREDGSLVILSDSGILVSKDNGATWDEETPDWLSDVRQEGVYIMSMAMAPDGTTALLWGEIVGLEDSWNQWLKLVLPDGTQAVFVETASINRNQGFENVVVMPMEGQCSRVFKPATMAAVSAVSGHPDLAMGFMDVFLSASVQGMYDGLPLNQNAFDFQFTPDLERLDEEGVYGSRSTMDEDGNTISVINSYWPADSLKISKNFLICLEKP